jgi:hypothetical protein
MGDAAARVPGITAQILRQGMPSATRGSRPNVQGANKRGFDEGGLGMSTVVASADAEALWLL